jgi:hypothetical protein
MAMSAAARTARPDACSVYARERILWIVVAKFARRGWGFSRIEYLSGNVSAAALVGQMRILVRTRDSKWKIEASFGSMRLSLYAEIMSLR